MLVPQAQHDPGGSNRDDVAARATSLSLPQSSQSPQVIVVQAGGRQTVAWVIALLLAVIATALVDRWDNAGLSRSAMAQQTSGTTMSGTTTPGPMGARGIYAFTGQLARDTFGLFMMDVDSGTIWCYQMGRGRDGELQMQLIAARSWIYDRFLEEFNVAQPTPNEVQMMVRQHRAQAAGMGTGVGAGAGSETGAGARAGSTTTGIGLGTSPVSNSGSGQATPSLPSPALPKGE